MLENLFRFLFKYPPLLFQQGDFSWGLSRPVLLAVMVAAAIAILALLTYRGVSPTDKRIDRAVLVALRLAVVCVLLICLFRPTLILKADAQGDLRAQNEEVAKLLPKGRLVHIAGAGHNVRRENKAQTVETLNAFLAGS